MIIDFHTHMFPDALAPRALASLLLIAGYPVVFDGTSSRLTALLNEVGVDCAVILNTVTNERQDDKVNAFALETSKNQKNLIPFCSFHPLNDSIYESLKELKESGIKGVKHHPDYIGMDFDDERMHPLLSAVSKLQMPLVIHAGFDPVSPNHYHASPDAILKVLFIE